MINNTTWMFQGQPLSEPPSDAFGFIYLMVHAPSGKKYIGRKQLWFTKTRQVKGKKKKFKVESDWRDYYSSSPEILTMIELEGTEVWTREVLMFAPTKGSLGYAEENLLHKFDVLLSDEWFNGNIRSKLMKKWFAKIDIKPVLEQAEAAIHSSSSSTQTYSSSR